MMYKVDAMFDSFSKAATALRVSVLFLALFCAQGFPSAAPAWAEPESGLTLDFKDADIHALIKYISEATGRNFITDPTVKGKVTVYSPVKISPDEAFETFVSILRVQGYAVQKSGTAYKIVPLKEGLGQGEDAAVGRKMGSELETVVTQIVPLKVGVAAELAKNPSLPAREGLRHFRLYPVEHPRADGPGPQRRQGHGLPRTGGSQRYGGHLRNPGPAIRRFQDAGRHARQNPQKPG